MRAMTSLMIDFFNMLINAEPDICRLRFFILLLQRQTKNGMRNFNLQIVTAAILAIGGLILLFCGVYLDPQGEIHESLLIGFGEVATFAGALFGIDAAYSKKLWDYINLYGNKPPEKPSPDNSTAATSTE